MAGRADYERHTNGETKFVRSPRSTGLYREPGREDLLRELREINERLVVASVRQQELAEQAQRQAAQWNAVLNSLNEGVIVVDARAHVVMINPTGRELLRLSPSDVARPVTSWELPTFENLDGRVIVADEQPIVRALRGEAYTDYEIAILRSDARRLRITFNGSTVADDRGRVILAICVFRDVSELRELAAAREEYVALISHDLRGPLTNIVGRAELLYQNMVRRGGGLEPDLKNVAAIRKSAKHMNAMIQDLVDTAQLESGKFTLHLAPSDLVGLVRDIVDGVLAPEDLARISLEVEEPIPTVRVDHYRIQRVVSNLLSNALKYSTPPNPVVIHVSRSSDRVEFSVADLGIGISPENLARLFEKYYRTPQSLTTEGLGLGLYIARMIVEASGGTIWAVSEQGKGSTFAFSLPLN